MFFLLWFLGLGQTANLGQVQTVVAVEAYQHAISQAQVHLNQLRTEYKCPGISICVGTATQVLWHELQGYADLDTQSPLTTDHLFRIGSTSKALTSIGLGILIEQGKLDLNAPIQHYVPSFPKKKYPITLRQLAGHQAGIRDYDFAKGEYHNQRHFHSITEALAIFQDSDLLFEPGTQYQYTTYGYTLLSAAMESAAQTDFLTFMQTAIFQPLALKHTHADDVTQPLNRVSFYGINRFSGAVEVLGPIDNSNKWAGGGFLSTSGDLVAFGSGLLRNALIQKETRERLFTPQSLTNGEATQYGIGWRSWQQTLPSGAKVRVAHHGGTAYGAMSMLVVFPDDDLVVALNTNLLNRDGWAFMKHAFTFADFFLQARSDTSP
ncbi:MAG: beta-lactamase family protein [Acidobacteria bacterium]|nr:beta-lactamase family protein [Acidobacteriota bacterium]MCB9396617.1 beta-lactamase family protein [Acidobacteriota bacterium]